MAKKRENGATKRAAFEPGVFGQLQAFKKGLGLSYSATLRLLLGRVGVWSERNAEDQGRKLRREIDLRMAKIYEEEEQ